MKTTITLFCLILLGIGYHVFGCPCDPGCVQPQQNLCPEGQTSLCVGLLGGVNCACTCVNQTLADHSNGIRTPVKDDENFVESTDSDYSLTVEIDSAAASVLTKTGYDLALFKGYREGGVESFDTAWQVLANNALVESSIVLMWRSYSKAGFVKTVEENSVILQQDTKFSDQFEGGQRVTFNTGGWNGPTDSDTASPPYFEVEYTPADHLMHLTLLAPVPSSDGTEEWTPYFYDKYAMDENSVSSGYPTTSLYVKLTRDIREATYTGSAYKTGKRIDFGDSNDMTICISTTEPTNLDLQITLGNCKQADKSGTEMA